MVGTVLIFFLKESINNNRLAFISFNLNIECVMNELSLENYAASSVIYFYCSTAAYK